MVTLSHPASGSCCEELIKDLKVLCDLYLVCNWKTLSSNFFLLMSVSVLFEGTLFISSYSPFGST